MATLEEAIETFSGYSELQKREYATSLTADPTGNSEYPIHIFTDIGWYELLLPYVSIDIKSHRYNITVLIHAITSKNKDVVRWLVEHGADVNAVDNRNGYPPVAIVACGYGDPDLLDIILPKSPRFDITCTPVNRRCGRCDNPWCHNVHCVVTSMGSFRVIQKVVSHLDTCGAFTPKLAAVYLERMIRINVDVGYLETFLVGHVVDPRCLTCSYYGLGDKSTFIPEYAPLLATYGLLTPDCAYHYRNLVAELGMYDVSKLFIAIGLRGGLDADAIMASPRGGDIEMLYLAAMDKSPPPSKCMTRCALSRLRNSFERNPKYPEVLRQIERIYYAYNYTRPEGCDLPTLFDLVEFDIHKRRILDGMAELKSRIKKAQITKDWHSILPINKFVES